MKDFEVYENNGGCLALVVYGDFGNIEYIHTGYEFNPGQLSKDIENIKADDDPAMMWDGNELEEFGEFQIEEFASGAWGTLIADNFGEYPFAMGAAGEKEFCVDSDD